jgi:ketosteroid isomerase-like protein
MSTQESLDIVNKGFAAFGSGNLPGLLELMAENVEWEIPGAGLRLAGTYRGPQG